MKPTNHYNEFTIDLINHLTHDNQEVSVKTDKPYCVFLKNQAHDWISLNLTPIKLSPYPVTANKYFSSVHTIDDLLAAYQQARSSLIFETDLHDAITHVSTYSDDFLNKLFVQAQNLTNKQASLIANWLKNLDIYTAVKATESLFNSKADLSLLEISQRMNWQVHFDHIAIRCGSQKNNDAERIVEMLIKHHGYSFCQIKSEEFYRFKDGWNAYVLYKILENGQMLRIFIDQSAEQHPKQIIQHWNHVYGYTAHHMAIRATRLIDNKRHAISLKEISQALQKQSQEIMTPTGDYTLGLLEQVFTRPEINNDIPKDLLDKISQIDANLSTSILNGKLLEIVSRTELPEKLKSRYFELYGLHYNTKNPLHSAPIYHYFLPAQAAHVIKTSLE